VFLVPEGWGFPISSMKILVVEDDELTGLALSQALTYHHYTVDVAQDGRAGLTLTETYEYDLLLLDVLVPELDGISLCRKLRDRGYQKPILLLTAKDSRTDRITGLDAGADDYVVKPYDLSELLARIRALLRRSQETRPTPTLSWGELCFNPISSEVTYRQQAIALTPKEYSLLELFLRNPQRVFSRSAILDRLWSLGASPAESAVTTHIKDLRQKLRASGLKAEVIETVYGLGYRLATAPSATMPEPKAQEKAARLAQGIESLRQVIERFRHSFGDQVAVLEQMQEALQAGTLAADLYQQAYHEAHKLAGSLGMFGYPAASKTAREIEHLLVGSSPEQLDAKLFSALLQRLQTEMAQPPEATVADHFPQPQAEAQPKVLLIDDDVALAEALRSAAIAHRLELQVVTDLSAARQVLTQCSPEVVLLDLNFPEEEEGGMALLAEIRQQMPKLPVLVFTGRDSLSDRLEASRLGAQGFLSKPIPTDQVIQAVLRLLTPQPADEARILAVDNNLHTLQKLAELLRPWGVKVFTLDDPQNFWQGLTSTLPDLLILAQEMTEIGGLELCQVVRQDWRWGNLPILVMTSQTDSAFVRALFRAGADDFIRTPILEPELITRVLCRLERGRSRLAAKGLSAPFSVSP